VTVDAADVEADMVDVATLGGEEDEVTWSELGHRWDPGTDSRAGLRGAVVVGATGGVGLGVGVGGISTPMDAYSSWVKPEQS
jgi:hypothetical protein